ncbi:MAG: hypothetical protein JWL71_3920 [Acidobacteria bacterium]|nr:hypothetical protein [Acidobacteriota bacterium]
MRNATRLIGLAALIAATVSCGDVVRQGSSPVFLVIDSLGGLKGGPSGAATVAPTLASDVITNVTSPAPCSAATPCPTTFADTGQVTLRAPLKDPGATATLAPTTNNEITISRVHVEYVRADGRNTQGADVPFAFDSAVTGTIPAGGTLQLGFELVRNVAKQESPLAQLRTSSNFISTIAKVTFYGADRVGNAIQVTGQLTIEFGNFGDF